MLTALSCWIMQTDESKEKKRQEALERKVKLYDELQRRVNLDDEAANDLHEVDFIGKALGEDALSEELHPSDTSPSILRESSFPSFISLTAGIRDIKSTSKS